jgi:hypothetical protein
MLKTPWLRFLVLTGVATLLVGCAVDDPYYYHDDPADGPVYYYDRGREPYYAPAPYRYDDRPRYYHDRKPPPDRHPQRPPRDKHPHKDWHERDERGQQHPPARPEVRPVRPPPPQHVQPSPPRVRPKVKPHDAPEADVSHPNAPRYHPKTGKLIPHPDTLP